MLDVKRLWTIVFGVLLFLFASPLNVFGENSQMDEVFVVYKNEAGKNLIKEVVDEILYEFESISALMVSIDKELIYEVLLDPNIAHVEQNSEVKVNEGDIHVLPKSQIINEPSHSGLQWNLKAINAENAWEDQLSGEGVKVAVVDTGIMDHSDLEVSGGISTVGYTNSWTDDNGHGTHVAGIIGAADNYGIGGIAPNAELFAVKALDQSGNGNLGSILEGIDWSISNGMDIINFSIGSEKSSIVLEEMLKTAYNEGVLLVSSSGNSGTEEGDDNNVKYPAKDESVIAVGAVDNHLKRASFSSTGGEVEFSAPGVDIISTYLWNQYASANGTSFAAPHVSSMLALLVEKYPQKNNKELRDLLKNYMLDLGEKGKDSLYGYGFPRYTPNISRIDGANLYETSALISSKGWDHSEVVILARGDRFSDALAGVPLAALYDAPVILTRNDRLDPVTRKEIERLDAKEVIILGGHLAIEDDVEESLKEINGLSVRRIAGDNLHVTAEMIAHEVAPGGSSKAIIVSDNRFQDALSVASYAGAGGIPILLANTNELPQATIRALQELNVQETLVIGGEMAISEEVFEKLPVTHKTRLGGKTMYDTNVLSFEYFKPNKNNTFIATSERFPDGLSGAALAARDNTSVIIVGDSVRDITQNKLSTIPFGQINVLGGELAINDHVFSEVKRTLNIE
ncbi:S8 family serine peptidase [Bacillus shivajii]|uniref:S8 family serine peptidase n=1 Tax=Bacillus shivajii TaxID=1983719 RepID=UPI001CF995B4|nr:S8 family serine peptidase [Bacillus shivajii]UCZ52710.1 S8 family serine peptidase [Bacillus shivajii]